MEDRILATALTFDDVLLVPQLSNVIPFAYLEFTLDGVNEEDTNLTSGVRVKDSGSNINAMMDGGIGVGSDAVVHARRN